MTTTLDHIDGLRDVFTDLTQDCLMLDLTPCTVRVSRTARGDFDSWVQFSGTDVASVDALCDSWELPPALGAVPGKNYTRQGRFDLNGRRVEVIVFTGCPALPTYPAGYAPQAVEDEAPSCPACHGSGQVAQQHDGLIIECPRGCMTAADSACTECGAEVSRPGLCFDCDVRASYVGGLAPRFGAQP